MNGLIRVGIWLLRAVVFVGLFGLAIKNSSPIELHFFFNQIWVAPVSLVVLIVFFAGAVLGLTTALGVLVRNKRIE